MSHAMRSVVVGEIPRSEADNEHDGGDRERDEQARPAGDDPAEAGKAAVCAVRHAASKRETPAPQACNAVANVAVR